MRSVDESHQPVSPPVAPPATPEASPADAAPEEAPEAAQGVAWWRRLAGVGRVPLPPGADRVALLVLLVEALVMLGLVRRGFSKPFWYDEQQRSYQIALPARELWRQLGDAESPLALGWIAIEKAFAWVLGNVEWAYRLPVALSLPALGWATYRLARRWLGVAASFVVAALLLANSNLLRYIDQIKQYPAEALFVVLAMLIWFWANEPGRGNAARVAGYAGLGLCTLIGTATLFALAPLLVIDLARALRQDGWLRRLGPAVLAGGIALAHLVLFILPQDKVAGAGSDWEPDFMPHASLGAASRFLAHQARSFFPEVAGGAPNLASPGLRHGVTVVMLLALAGGCAVGLRDRRIRPLLAVFAGAMALQLAASAVRRWPFGFVRVNLFVVPLFYLLGGVGVAVPLAALARRALARGPTPHAGPAWRAAAAAGLAAVALLAVLGGGLVAHAGAAQDRLLHASSGAVGWGDGIRGLVARTRQRAAPGDLAIVVRRMGFKGWAYYMWESYDGWPPKVRSGPVIDAGHTLMSNRPTAAEVRAFLAAHPRPEHVFALVMANAYAGTPQAVEQALRQAGFHLVERDPVAYTGTLWVLQ